MKLRLLLAGLLTLMTGLTHANDLSEWKPLLSVTELHELLEEDPFAATVVDIRALDAKEPEASYNAGHIPGAISSPYATWRGQPDNPGKFVTQDKLTWLVQAIGADIDTPVVVVHRGDSYSDFGAAARVYWSLKTAGLTQLAILNGGFQAWKQAGLPISTELETPLPSDFPATIQLNWLAQATEVEAQLNKPEVQLLDARPDDFFEGFSWHPAASKPGTIAGAVAFDNERWFRSGGPLLESPERLQSLVQENKLGKAEITVSFCNTGHWAATNWFVLSEIAGKQNVKLYPESLVEWSTANLPMDNVPNRLQWAWISTKQWLISKFN